MKTPDLPRLTALLKRLCAVFNRGYSEALLEGYMVGLRDADIDQVEANGIAWLTTGHGMPTPRDLSRGTAEVSEERVALSVWAGVLSAIRGGRHVEDVLAAEIMDGFGGIRAVGGLPSEQVHGFIRREFVKAYVEASRDDATRELAASLAGRDKQLPS